MNTEKTYIAIDLKSFYASVECVERGLDPLTTNLVVADPSRTQKTICLAVSPSLKAYGIPGRARLFEVIEKVNLANAQRRRRAPRGVLFGSSYDDKELMSKPSLSIDYITAVPRMALYLEYSTRIYQVYLKHVAPEDIHVYSIDEVFIDATSYLKIQKISAQDFARRLIKDIHATTGIVAAAGIGTNLYLCKVAMDIVAKHVDADEYGVRIAQLDEISYRKLLWDHKPLTDFWRVGKGYADKLAANGIYTMGDVARCSLGDAKSYYNEELLYKLFGINAELLIDHAWGWEPCTLSDIKAYKPSSGSISSGQVLHCPYGFEQARLVVTEMADLLVLELVDKGLVTDQIVLTVGYDIDNLKDPHIGSSYSGDITTDYYGRRVPKHAHGTVNLGRYTSSTRLITEAVAELFDRIVNKELLVRRINITAARIVPENSPEAADAPKQLDIFTNVEELDAKMMAEKAEHEREKRVQRAVLDIKKKFGKNSIIKGMNLEEGATAKERNEQIGGHKA